MFPFADFSFEQLEKSVLGNLVNQTYLARLVLPIMIKQGGGTYISLSSNAAVSAPPAPPGKGGWGFVYGAPKSAFHRIAEFIHVEHAKDGILAFNVEPGFTVTEATVAMFGAGSAADFNRNATTPATTGDVVAWLATRPEARELAGTLIGSPGFFKSRGITSLSLNRNRRLIQNERPPYQIARGIVTCEVTIPPLTPITSPVT